MKTAGLVLLSISVLQGCKIEPLGLSRRKVAETCETSLKNETQPCELSIYAIAANPVCFSGMLIAVTGFYGSANDGVLYTDRESSDNRILKNGISLVMPASASSSKDRLDLRPSSYQRVSGLFLHPSDPRVGLDGKNVGQYLGLLRTVGVERTHRVGPGFRRALHETNSEPALTYPQAEALNNCGVHEVRSLPIIP